MFKKVLKKFGALALATVMVFPSMAGITTFASNADEGSNNAPFIFHTESTPHTLTFKKYGNLSAKVGGGTADYVADVQGITTGVVIAPRLTDSVHQMTLSGLPGTTVCVNPVVNTGQGTVYNDHHILEATVLDANNIDAFFEKYASVMYPESFLHATKGVLNENTDLHNASGATNGEKFRWLRSLLPNYTRQFFFTALLAQTDSATLENLKTVTGTAPAAPFDYAFVQCVAWNQSVDNLIAEYKYGKPMGGNLFGHFADSYDQNMAFISKIYQAIKEGKVRVSLPKITVSQNTIAGYPNVAGTHSRDQVLNTISGKFDVNGKLSIVKVSAKPNYTTNNKAYDMTGATYGVFSDAACTNKVGELVVKDNTGETEPISLTPGNYWVKEIAPAKAGYGINTNVKQLSVTAGQHNKAQLDGDMLEPCLVDPMFAMVQKNIAGSKKAGELMGDIPTLEGVKFRVSYYTDLYKSVAEAKEHTPAASAVFATDAKGRLLFQTATPVEGEWTYKDANGRNIIPLGTCVIEEVSAIEGLKVGSSASYQIIDSGDHKNPKHIPIEGISKAESEASVGAFEDPAWAGSVKIVKADKDLNDSTSQGDANIEGAKVDIINRSANPVAVDGKIYAPGEVVLTLTMTWNDADKAFEAKTSEHALPYGTYEITEQNPSGAAGYHTGDGEGWSRTFSIRKDGEVHSFDLSEGDEAKILKENAIHYGWMKNKVYRGGVIVGKVDRETKQYSALGEAKLDGSIFEIVNKSKKSVVVDGKTYKVDEVVKTITAEPMEYNGKNIVAAFTGDDSLPYGTYEIREKSSGKGYLFDKTSKQWSKTFKIRKQGEVIDLTGTDDAVANQVIREDFHFLKKQEAGSSERMPNVAWLITSKTTGEKHIVVTDENGGFDSEAIAHSEKTNANDPTSPISNGAVAIDEDGNWYVKDSSKLDAEAGVWFTGTSPDATKWTDGKTYEVNGETQSTVNDKLRAFPYDQYLIEELRSDANEGFGLITVGITLHRFTKDHDGAGINYDYGTLNDKAMGVGTTLTYGASEKVVPAAKDTVLNDKVSFWGLAPNKAYTLKGELHLVDADGNDEGVVAEAEKEFNSGRGEGDAVASFTVDTTDMGGKKLVAFETVVDAKGKAVAKHKDLKDEGQTVSVPKIGTTLKGDSDNEALAKDDITLVDTIKYTNLEVGKKYQVSGALHVKDKDGKDAGELKDKNGNPITATSEFVATKTNGEAEVTFNFKNDGFAGKTVVAFESVSKDGVTYAVHADIKDKAQTVHFPKLKTKALDAEDNDKMVQASSNQKVSDAVTILNITKGNEYKLVGEVHVRGDNGEDLGAIEGAVADKTFTAESGNEEQSLTFKFDASKYAGKTLVVFEKLYRGDVLIGSHEDINDEGQSVYVPSIGTTLTGETGHVVNARAKTIKLEDTVKYKGLEQGKEYTVEGVLHVQKTDENGKVTDNGVLKDKNGKEVTGKVKFTAEKSSGTVKVVFEFEAPDLEGNAVVAFETLKQGDTTYAVHADIKDEGQTVRFPKIGTKASDAATKTNQGALSTKVSIIDTVEYKGLEAGKAYDVIGTLHLQKLNDKGEIVDGGIVKDINGNDVTAKATFVAEKSNGKAEVAFNFEVKSDALIGKTVVAFEDLKRDGVLLASHADIKDEAQSVRFMEVGTTLTEAGSGAKVVGIATDIKLVDKIEYKNLTVGEEYTFKGRLVDANGKTLKDAKGNEAVAEKTVKITEANGKLELEFSVDTSKMTDGTKIVAFEQVFAGETLVGSHEDLNDEGQTVTVVTSPEKVRLNTGIDNYALAVTLGMLGITALAGAALAIKRRKANK